jgi:hypothetical protein
MSGFYKHRILKTWITCFAILFGSLAPSLSYALAAASPGSATMEICTRAGIMLVAAADSGADQSRPAAAQDHLKHCPCCPAQHEPLALLPPLLLEFAVIGGHGVFPALFYDAPHPLFSWSAANPRAPPVTA